MDSSASNVQIEEFTESDDQYVKRCFEFLDCVVTDEEISKMTQTAKDLIILEAHRLLVSESEEVDEEDCDEEEPYETENNEENYLEEPTDLYNDVYLNEITI
jgi:hypothetical protein